MALIGTIRKNGWILIVIMTLALGGFILMDVVSNSQRYSASDINLLGKVGDKEIKRSEFETYEKLIYSDKQRDDSYQVRNQTWDYFVEKAIVEKEANAMGLGVCKEELLDLQFGLNISPIIAERFKNPDGSPNRQTLAGIKNAIETGQFTDPNNRAYWAIQEKEVVKARLEEKVMDLVSKGMYTPKWQAEMAFKEGNERRDFCAVRVLYDKIKDEEVKVGDSDYSAFLKENKGAYDQQEETRTISYITFDVLPTAADSATSRESVAKFSEGLRSTKTDSTFVMANGGTFQGRFVPKSFIPKTFVDSVMIYPIGSVVGPVLDGAEYKIIKILDRKVLPDSVRARHIFVRDATPENESTIDSIFALLKSGKMNFDTAALKMSQDPATSVKGGDLGWLANGSILEEINELCFVTGTQGILYKKATKVGWHIVEITGKKFITNDPSVKVATIERRVEPSKNTQEAKKDKAVALVQQAKSLSELESIATQQNLKLETSATLKINDFMIGTMGTGDDVREVLRWAFDEKNKAGSISKEVFSFGDPTGGYFDSKYIVAAVKGIVPQGKATVASLKSIPEAVTRVKNLKKSEIILSRLQNPSDLPSAAATFGLKVDTLSGANFQNGSIEPRVTGIMFALETGQMSKPIVGNSGVIVAQPLTDKTQPPAPADLTMFSRQLTSTAITTIKVTLMNSLKRNNKIKDNRAMFW